MANRVIKDIHVGDCYRKIHKKPNGEGYYKIDVIKILNIGTTRGAAKEAAPRKFASYLHIIIENYGTSTYFDNVTYETIKFVVQACDLVKDGLLPTCFSYPRLEGDLKKLVESKLQEISNIKL